MSTLAEILVDVLDIVPQPDKERLIRNKINAAINLISRSGFFWRDIEEVTITSVDGVDVTGLVQSIPITTLQRKFIGVVSTNEDEKPITILDPLMVQKAICQGMIPIAYIAGSTLHIKHQQVTPSFNLTYYRSPDAFAINGDDDGESNWITDSVPELVVDLASAYILNTIGQSDDSKRITELAMLLRGTYIKDFVETHIST
ncbi:MAG: hypothetical protein KIS69_10310 [Bacteroidetes bacterium]|nr:hypothetical protein [Bacteroidota bacterium]